MLREDKVNLGGIIPISTVDWYGKVVSVIFFRECPLRCIYCQNHHLLTDENYVDLSEIESEIKKSEYLIDGVMFSGGEPFFQFNALKNLARFVKNNSLLVGIETNGFYPDRIREMMEKKLVDAISLDVKAPLSDEKKYEKICMRNDVVNRVRESISICEDVDLEITTTVFRDLIEGKDVEKIAGEIADVRCRYVIQQGIPEQAPDEEVKKHTQLNREEIIEMGKIARNFLRDVRIRTRDRGEERIDD